MAASRRHVTKFGCGLMGLVRQRPGIGVGLAHERPAHAANPVLTVTMRILAFILAADALKPDGI